MSKQSKVAELKPRNQADGETTLTRRVLLNIWNTLAVVSELIRAESKKQPIENPELAQPSGKFMFAIARNQGLLEGEITALTKVSGPVDAMVIYNNERIELCKEWAERDENDEPRVDADGNYVMADQEAFNTAFKELKAAHKEAFDAQETRNKEFEELLDSDCAVRLHRVAAIHVPRGLMPEHWGALQPILFDEES